MATLWNHPRTLSPATIGHKNKKSRAKYLHEAVHSGKARFFYFDNDRRYNSKMEATASPLGRYDVPYIVVTKGLTHATNARLVTM